MPKNAPLTLGKRIQWARKKIGLNQHDFAKKIDIGKRTLAYYEGDDRTPDAVIGSNMARLCNISVHWLLTGEGSPDLPQEAETAADAGDGSDQGQNALKHGSGHSGIDKANSVNVNLAHSKTTRGEAMSGDRLLRYVEYLENENKQLKQKVKEFEDREKQREAANQ